MLPSFLPSLGTTTPVAVRNAANNGDAQAQELASVRVSLVARLSDSEYAEAISTGVRMEVWTDAPTPGKPSGEWSAVSFDPIQQGVQQTAPEVVLDITSGETVNANEQSQDGHNFYAQLVLPKSVGRRFSFTYRLVYPSGIQWLGSGNNNGVLELVADEGFFQETGVYLSREDLRMLQVRKEGGDNVHVGRLLTDQWRWSGWAIDGSSVKTFALSPTAEAVEGRFVYAIPEAKEGQNILAPQAYVFRTTSRLSFISVAPDGQVSLHTPNTTSFDYKALDLASDNSGWLDRAFASSFGSSGITYISPDTALYSFDHDDRASAKVYVMPLTKDSHEMTTIPLSLFTSFSAPAHLLSALNSETNQVVFADVSEESGIKSMGLTRRSYVGSFAICATYTLSVDPAQKWMIASPSFDARPVLLANLLRNQLPTPPDSPRLRQRHFASFALPSAAEAEGESEDNVSAPLDDSPPPPSSARHGSDASISRARRSDIVTQLGALHIQDRLRTVFGPTLVNSLITMISTLTIFFTVTFRRLFMILFSTYPQPRPRALTPPSSPPQNPPSDKITPVETGSADIQGHAPNSDQTHSASPPESTTTTKEVLPAPEDVNQSTLGATVVSEDAAPHSHTRDLSYNALEWAVPADTEVITLLVKCVGGVTKVDGLRIEIKGQAVDPQTIKTVGDSDGATVLEITRPDGAPSQLLVGLRS